MSFLLLNSGDKVLLNDGSSFVLLNGEVSQGRTGFGGFGRLRKRQVTEQAELITHVHQQLRLHPFILRKLKLKILLKAVNPLLQKLNIKIASLPDYTNNIIRMAMKMDQPKSFTFEEPIKDWLTAEELEREITFSHTSSFVGKVTFTPELNTMEINLNGKVYGFCHVPFRIFDSFEGAASKGAYFTRIIKGQFDC